MARKRDRREVDDVARTQALDMTTAAKAPVQLLEGIAGQPFRGAMRSYGDELVLAFGDPVPEEGLRTPLASFVLFTRATPWSFGGDAGTIATDKNRLSDRLLSRLHTRLGNSTVARVAVLEEALGLVLVFSTGDRFSLWPTPSTVASRSGGDLWELATPRGASVVATARVGLVVRPGDEPVG